MAISRTVAYITGMAEQLTIGFLGAGKMASALAKGFLKAGLIVPRDLIASDPIEAARISFTAETAARTVTANTEIVQVSNVLIIAVKPATVSEVLAEIRDQVTGAQVIISIAGGITLSKLEGGLNAGMRVIRVMPNTPAMVGCSASAYALGRDATQADGELAQRLLTAVGMAFQVKEPLLDAVTGLSGSGPAYVCMIIEALSDGGVAAGLPRDIATKLAAQTVLGSAKMVLDTGAHPGALKDMVTSPGGTTIEGVHELEKGGLRAALISAVRAASDKSRKLGQG